MFTLILTIGDSNRLCLESSGLEMSLFAETVLDGEVECLESSEVVVILDGVSLEDECCSRLEFWRCFW